MGMDGNDLLNKTFESENRRNRKSQIISILILFILIVCFSLWRSHGTESLKILWTEESLIITEPSGDMHSLKLENIDSISYQSGWDFGNCTGSREDRFSRCGSCENEMVGRYQCYAFKNSSSVILIRIEKETYAISYESDTITKNLYEALPETFEELGLPHEIIFQ